MTDRRDDAGDAPLTPWGDDAGAGADMIGGRPVLVATDGSPAAGSAIRVAARLAAVRQVRPHVLRVLDLTAYPVPRPLPSLILAANALIGDEVRAADVEALRGELGELLGTAPDWPLHVDIGTPAGAIVREASLLAAELIVMGARRHRALDRALGDATTLEVMRRSPCPLLGVSADLVTLPRRAVVGVDFGRASVRAARAALAVLEDGGTLMPVYVQPPRDAWSEDAEGMRIVQELGVEAAFRRLADELRAGQRAAVEPVVVDCEPGAGTGAGLRTFAGRVDADLLAVGSQRHGRVERWLLGSVTTELVRRWDRSLLVVPPRLDGGRERS
jgi:nucleotide-binding universal stress UspA family protein